MSLCGVQIQNVSAAKFDALTARLGHYEGLSLTKDGNGCNVVAEGLCGRLVHDPASNTLSVELEQIPGIITPGDVIGRLYDEIHCSNP